MDIFQILTVTGFAIAVIGSWSSLVTLFRNIYRKGFRRARISQLKRRIAEFDRDFEVIEKDSMDTIFLMIPVLMLLWGTWALVHLKFPNWKNLNENVNGICPFATIQLAIAVCWKLFNATRADEIVKNAKRKLAAYNYVATENNEKEDT